MKKTFQKFVMRYGRHFCMLAVTMAILASEKCKMFWYQPEEPEGLAEFAARKCK